MTKKRFKIDGINCESCAKMIELDLEDAGFACRCNYVNKTIEVEIENQQDLLKVKGILEKGGYKLQI